MAIRAALHHRTVYEYDRDVELGPQVVRLRPAPHCRTPILSYSLRIEPGPPGKGHFINWQQDPHGNHLARLVFPEKVRRFAVEVDLVADLTVINPFEFFLEKSAEQCPFVYDDHLRRELAPYLETLPAPEAGERFEAFLAQVDRSPRATVGFLVDLNQMVNRALRYTLRMDPGVRTPEETLVLGSGSCRDMTWFM
ncbi:MAG: IMP dehydrogenase, partial [Verrucomicrobiae bacterium]|nr:IMP dehydrogenase [Verrucomicrobiae bacterium]